MKMESHQRLCMESQAIQRTLPSEGLTFEPSIKEQLASELAAGGADGDLEDRETNSRVEEFLLGRVSTSGGDKTVVFQLAQFYFELDHFEKAFRQFDKIKDEDRQALFQFGVMTYDGIGTKSDPLLGVSIMRRIAGLAGEVEAKHLAPAAKYNIGRAYYQGVGVEKQSDEEAERWWLEAADDGNPKGSIKAQTMLGMFYSRPESLDLKRSFFWHSEACGNGSLESQGALGVMYMFALGVNKKIQSAFECLKEAADRGNVYAMGNLVALYYERKLFTKASDLGCKVAQLEDPLLLSKQTGCLPVFIAKGMALACFYYGRCLHLGKVVTKDEKMAAKFYSKSFELCSDVAAILQDKVIKGEI